MQTLANMWIGAEDPYPSPLASPPGRQNTLSARQLAVAMHASGPVLIGLGPAHCTESRSLWWLRSKYS